MIEVTDMKGKMNCWEYNLCGREPGGRRVQDLGVCPVTTYRALDGAHGGHNAGRACWAIAGSLCGEKMQGTHAQKLRNCWKCEFMKSVKNEEDLDSLGFFATRLGMEKALEKQKQRHEAPRAAVRIDEP